MSIDRSLRGKGTLERHRNVLTRAERIAFMQDRDKWPEQSSPLGLPKVAHRKAKAGKKDAKDEKAGDEAGEEETEAEKK